MTLNLHHPLNDHPTPHGSVLVVDDHASARNSVADVLRCVGYHADACASGAEALRALAVGSYQVVVTDLQMPGMSGLELIREIERLRLGVQVLMVTAHASVTTAVEAMRHGAFDYLEKPFDATQLEDAVGRAMDRASISGAGENASLSPMMIGESRVMRSLRERLRRIAASDETVLICGESGVGKELIAQSIHAASRRATGPMVSLNCPVLSRELTESELFGHRRGAFTGADADRVGRFESAEGGSLLLDEITEIDMGLQAKLLRVLQERTFERVGSSESQRVDVRVMATTNRDLTEEIAAGRFREDLYYRLAVVPLVAPPLREREGDVSLLADHFLSQAAERLGRPAIGLADDARTMLEQYQWPGNVRELHNLVTRACVLAEGDEITAALVRPWLHAGSLPQEQADAGDALPVGMSLAEIERRMILATLEKFDGHRAKAAEALGIGVRTLSGKLRTYGVAPREKDFSRAA
ncbi:Transcriptional regulatory protein ZraR [Pseudobythopirellula maris]|uniref:Transcriptional regulatory protein ZraR n=1 Tax=Pseudobythopirellula maris TaxID=2527991 RepID=A0A5C5ZHR0_9BACT|nr:sigma-54 dependent transcriptional regulator [Pseudobythopirellula maris]TWT86527.1 Transcriptional regulatory protein ZraR [Pseudobythopirellula maris]